MVNTQRDRETNVLTNVNTRRQTSGYTANTANRVNFTRWRYRN